ALRRAVLGPRRADLGSALRDRGLLASGAAIAGVEGSLAHRGASPISLLPVRRALLFLACDSTDRSLPSDLAVQDRPGGGTAHPRPPHRFPVLRRWPDHPARTEADRLRDRRGDLSRRSDPLSRRAGPPGAIPRTVSLAAGDRARARPRPGER